MQKKEFKEFIKEADSKNDKLQNQCEQMKERIKRKLEDIKAQYELFKQNYLTDDISEITKAYKRYIYRYYGIDEDEDCVDFYINFVDKKIVYKYIRDEYWDFETYIDDRIGHFLNKSVDEFRNVDTNYIKNQLLRIENIVQLANKQIADIFDTIKQEIEDGLQADADKFNSITFDDDDTEQVIKKYKVTINIEEV